MSKGIRDIALLVLINKDGKLLLQHRTHDAPVYPDCWDFFGGGLEINETPEAAIKREIEEEIEYRLIDPKLVYKETYDGQKNNGARYIFVAQYDHSQQIILHEGQNFGWFYPNELSDLKTSPHVSHILTLIKLP